MTLWVAGLFPVLAPGPAVAANGDLWLLSVGVSQYRDAKINLDFPDHDAETLAKAMKGLEGSTFDKVTTTLLVNQGADKAAILGAMRSFASQASEEDVAVIAIAGHGVVASGKYYFLPHPADRSNLETEGISLAEFENEVRQISGRVGRVVLLIDTCHAGALDISVRGITTRSQSAASSSASSGTRSRGIGLAEPLAPKLREAYVLSSSTETEESLEDASYKLPGESKGHGAFTYALLRGIRGEADKNNDAKISVLELFNYTTTQVPKITGNRQHPWVDARGTDFPIANAPKRSVETAKQGNDLIRQARFQEAQGDLDDAAATYARAEQINPRDELPQLLRDNVEDEILYRKDPQRQSALADQAKKLIDESRKRSGPAAEDPWSPRPMVVTFLDFQTLGAVKESNGLHQILAQRVAQSLAGTKRVQVVERRLIEKILDELRLSMSDLSDPQTRLNVGKILVARLIASGDVVFVREPAFNVDLRLIDTETSEIKLNLMKPGDDPDRILALADEISASIIAQLQTDYPIRGKVISADGDEIVLNIGSKHGVTPSLKMKAITEEPIKVGDEVVAQRKKEIGLLEITSVEEKASFARIVTKSGSIIKGTKVIETLPSGSQGTAAASN